MSLWHDISLQSWEEEDYFSVAYISSYHPLDSSTAAILMALPSMFSHVTSGLFKEILFDFLLFKIKPSKSKLFLSQIKNKLSLTWSGLARSWCYFIA